ncbi:membrane protein [Orientia tsutsugamushi]|uniref:Putative ompA-like autotransporter n=1 Tax=Orientia tsutsugamushi (strain Boryong) TaxID=357244 RepID=A5CEA4_ORITB|nr:membrane protein [Orientia tsutsugamushi]CAM80385.1 putative ompA-like autotransporter [Orientia tsutsugamushi str. Boryong]
MNVLKSLLQPCYAVMLAAVVLFSPSICTANNNVNFNASEDSVDSSPLYIKFSPGVAIDHGITLETGIGYRVARHHRIDLRLGFLYYDNCINSYTRVNYYYNIIEGNKASMFVTGGLISAHKSSSNTHINLGVGTTINLSRDTYLDIECSTTANYRPLPIHIRAEWRVHI